MSIHPCPIRIDCDDQNPFANLSVEGPEPFWVPPPGTYWTAKGYCCDNTLKQVYSSSSQDNADDLLERTLVTACPTCEEQQKYCANATCPDGSNLQEVCVTTSQDDANALAAIAEAAMAPFCDSKEELYRADCACPDGITDPHTVYSSISQAVADAVCEAIPKDCGLDTPCNTPQTCVAPCPDGTLFSYTIAACTVKASTVELANAEAYRLACERALAQRVCLSPLDMCACVGEAYSSTVIATGVVPGTTITWQLSSGAPPGLSITASSTDGRAAVYGTPTTNGIYTFTIRAITGVGTYAEKTYRMYVVQITTASLPNYTVGVPYSQQLVAEGGSGHYSWSITSGTLPEGLALDPDTGIISGTPT